MSFFHGPGESEDNSGEGKGVTSDMALSIGEDTTELAAEPALLAMALFTLDERAIGMLLVFDNRRGDSSGLLCEADVVVADAAVKFSPGGMLV